MITTKRFNFSDKENMQIAHRIRHKVFVIGQNCPAELEWEFEEESTHFLVLKDDNAIATARYRKTSNGYKLERFAVLDKYQGRGYGHIILNRILDELINTKEKIYLHAQSQVISFYEKMGFSKYGDEFVEAGIKHYKMYLKSN